MEKKLFRVIVGHAAPKDVCYSTVCLCLAHTDEQVYEFLANEPRIKGEKYFNSWEEWEDDDENMREEYIKSKGELFHDDADWSDAYYGVTMLGWEEMKSNITSDFSELIALEFVFDLTINDN